MPDGHADLPRWLKIIIWASCILAAAALVIYTGVPCGCARPRETPEQRMIRENYGEKP
jgi:hypothetical protein